MENVALIQLANSQNWEYGSDWLRVSNATQANLVLSVFTDDLSLTAKKLNSDFWLKWHDSEIPIPSDMAEEHSTTNSNQSVITMNPITIPGITIAPLKLSEPLLRLFLEHFLPNPDKRMTLTRQSDHRQLAVSEAIMSQVKRPKVKLADIVNRTDFDFCYWSDIENADTECRLLTPNDIDSSVIVTRRVHDTTGQNWRAMDFEVRLIEDSWGTIYQFKTGLDVRSCSMPVYYEDSSTD